MLNTFQLRTAIFLSFAIVYFQRKNANTIILVLMNDIDMWPAKMESIEKLQTTKG